MRLKGKFYKSVIRPTILYSLECWAVDKQIEQRMSVVKMKMLKWINGMTRKDRIKNEYNRGSIRVALIMGKARENRYKWFGHVMRKEDLEAVRTIMELSMEGRGRPTIKWLNVIKYGM